MTDRRDQLLQDIAGESRKAMHLAQLIRSAAVAGDELTASNAARLDRVVLHLRDALATAVYVQETSKENAE